MADGEPEVVEQFQGILACDTPGRRLIKDKTFFFSYEVSVCDCRRLRFAKFLRLLHGKARQKGVGMKLWLEG
jgi:hypothetical protein